MRLSLPTSSLLRHAAALLLLALPARADLLIDITKGVTDPSPIAIVPFARAVRDAEEERG